MADGRADDDRIGALSPDGAVAAATLVAVRAPYDRLVPLAGGRSLWRAQGCRLVPRRSGVQGHALPWRVGRGLHGRRARIFVELPDGRLHFSVNVAPARSISDDVRYKPEGNVGAPRLARPIRTMLLG